MTYFYVYEDLGVIHGGQIVSSMRQLSELSGLSYRTVQRIFKKGRVYFDPDGRFSLKRYDYVSDKRISNGNIENLKTK
jgi:hypothetical protein